MVSYLGMSVITGIFLVITLIGTQYVSGIDCQKVELFENDRFDTIENKIKYCQEQVELVFTFSFIINILGLGVIVSGVILTFVKPKEKKTDTKV